MAWTAKIKSVVKQADEVHINVEMVNGQTTVGRIFKLKEPANLKQLIQTEIDRLTALFTFADGLKEGEFDLTLDAKPKPTPTDTAKEAFIQASAEYRKGLKLFEFGIITKEQLDAMRANVKSAYKPEYSSFVVKL